MACLEVEALTLLEENLVIETFLLLILWWKVFVYITTELLSVAY